MAERVGTMVGSRVLTREYVGLEMARVDLAGLIARGVERVAPSDLEAATRALARWLAGELSPHAAGELARHLRDALLRRPAAPMLAGVLEAARRRGGGDPAIPALAPAPAPPPEWPRGRH